MPLIFDTLPIKRIEAELPDDVMGRTATLSQSEKDDREARRLVKPAPQKKPPRTDLRRTHVEDRDTHDDDPDTKQDKKDQSRNYKDAALRVAMRYLFAEDAKDAADDTPEGRDKSEDVPVLNAKGRKVWVKKKTLRNPDVASKYRPYKKEDEGKAAPSKDAEPKSKTDMPTVPNVDEHGDTVDPIAPIRAAFPSIKYSKIFDALSEEDRASFKNLFEAEAATIGELSKEDLGKAVTEAEAYIRKADAPTDAKTFAKALAAIQHAQEITGGKEAVEAQTKKLLSSQDFNTDPDGRAIAKALGSFNLLQQNDFNTELASQANGVATEARKGLQNEGASDKFKDQVERARFFFSSEGSEARKGASPKDVARHAAVLLADHSINDPMVQFGIEDESTDPIPEGMEEEAAIHDQFDALAAYGQVKKNALDDDALKKFVARLKQRASILPANSPAQRKAAAVASALELRRVAISPVNQKIKGVHPAIANGIRAAALNGDETWFLETSRDTGKSPTKILGEISAKIGQIYGGLTNSELLGFLPEKMPLRGLAQDVFENVSSPASHKFVRESVILALQGQIQFTNVVDPEFEAEQQQAADVLEEDIEGIKAKRKWSDIFKDVGKKSSDAFKNAGKRIVDAVTAFLKRMAALFAKVKKSLKSTHQKFKRFKVPEPGGTLPTFGDSLPSSVKSRMASRLAYRYVQNNL
jgi:hypothetical protein